MFASLLADDTRVLHSHALSYCGVWATCSCGLCGVIWGISNAVFTNERTMAIDEEADSAPSAAIEQNKCVGVATATYDVWKRTMDPNNQSAHKLCSQPDCLVDTDLHSGQINPVLPAKEA